MKKRLSVSLKLQIIIGFLIPVIFIVLVGNAAYDKASEGLINNYEGVAMNSIHMASKMVDSGLQSLELNALALFKDVT